MWRVYIKNVSDQRGHNDPSEKLGVIYLFRDDDQYPSCGIYVEELFVKIELDYERQLSGSTQSQTRA